MPKYSYKTLRREILKTLAIVPRSSTKAPAFQSKTILNALRPTGFEDLTEPLLMAQIGYLEEKGYVKTDTGRNFVTEEEVILISLTAQGDDLLRGYCNDVGVDGGP